jgi:hypothetical protein
MKLTQRGGRKVVLLILATTMVATRLSKSITGLDQSHRARRYINTYQLNRNLLIVSTVALLNDSSN